MIDRDVIHVLETRIGEDASISIDEDRGGHRLDFYRPDRLSDDLVRDAVARASEVRPDIDWSGWEFFVSYEESLGRTRRRVAM